MSKTPSFWVAAAMAVAVTCPAAAQEPSAEYIRELIAKAQAQTQSQGQTREGMIAAASQPGPRVDLTADQAVARALERNVSLASQRLTPRTFDYALAANYAVFRPNVTSALVTNSTTSLPNRTIDGGDVTSTDRSDWNAGVNQALRWGGGSYNVGWTNNRQESNINNATFNPSYGSALQAQYVQPLLLNFKIDNNRTQIAQTRISQSISELDLQATVASTVAQVRNAYWELAYAQMNLDAQRRSLELASRLVTDNKARVEIGTMAPIDVVQAQAEEATRRQNVVAAEATLQNNELSLKRLIVSGTDDPLWTSTINATDAPSSGPEAIDLEAAVRNALGGRTDLQTTKRNIESANVSLRSFSNQTLPRLDLTTTYRLEGRGGVPTNPNGGFPISGWGNALANLRTLEAPTWTVRMDFAYPIGTSAAEANKARQQIIVQQNEAQVKVLELQIATEVTAAAIAIRNSQEAVRAATAARELSERRLEAAQSKFDVGMATNFEVVQAQRDLNDARNSELRQLLNYRRALVDFERVQISPR